ncbi:MAG: aminopeptidase P family protein [Chloroflexi bacterium]|nr:aminopeptidase P family protein [Chloroflexota bacterium]
MTLKIADRLKRLRQRIAEKELDAILVSQPENRYYLSGFDGSDGYLLITPRDTILATDFRYVEQVKIQAPEYRLFQITGNMADWLPRLLDGLNLRRLGFEAGYLTFAWYQQVSDILPKDASGLQLVPVDGLVESIRAIKEPAEIELLSQAIAITDRAVEYIESIVHAGMTEKELAWEIEKFQRENGSQSMPFDIIVASGPNAALPHAKPSPRPIGAGEPVVIDMGARVGGYSSDLSRTICLGTPDDTFTRIYNIVLEAQAAAIAGIKEGMSGAEADNIARAVIIRSGHGDAFGHSLGHGIGLATHELPRVGPGSTEQLTAGMVFSIEPGIYLADWGGVRIEDLAVIENNKIRVLSKARK